MGDRWEYKNVQLKPTTDTANGMVADQLNAYGEQGWEAWAIHINNWSGHTVRLKRRREDVGGSPIAHPEQESAPASVEKQEGATHG